MLHPIQPYVSARSKDLAQQTQHFNPGERMATPNTLFALIAVSDPDSLETKLEDTEFCLSKKVALDQWLLIAPSTMTTQEVSDALGVTKGETTSAIVLRVENYYGLTSTDTWEWIAAKIGVPLDATVS